MGCKLQLYALVSPYPRLPEILITYWKNHRIFLRLKRMKLILGQSIQSLGKSVSIASRDRQKVEELVRYVQKKRE